MEFEGIYFILCFLRGHCGMLDLRFKEHVLFDNVSTTANSKITKVGNKINTLTLLHGVTQQMSD
jgi:hypothetical protein